MKEKFVGKIKKIGSSHYILVPKNLAEFLALVEDDFVSIDIEKVDKVERVDEA